MSKFVNQHVIDSSYFYDAIEEFAFNYELYHVVDEKIDDYGEQHFEYSKTTIRGSLQSQGKRLFQKKSGNELTWDYNFYCKSLYRIDIGDIIRYKNNYMIVTSVNDYDEYGVRSCSLSMIQLTSYRDLADYVKYIEGDKIV